MSTIRHDVTFAVRSLIRAPAFSATSLVLLILAIGANIAIFSLLNSVFLRPLPVEEPSRLVKLYRSDSQSKVGDLRSDFSPISFLNYESFRDRSQAFSGFSAFCWMRANILMGDEVDQVWGEIVTANYFDVLGVQAVMGAVFSPVTSINTEGDPVVVLSDGLWHRFFDSDPEIVGKTIRVNGHQLVVLGVTPEGFKGTSPLTPKELWVPMGVYKQVFPYAPYVERRGFQMFDGVGRLKPNTKLDQARANLASVADWLQEEYPEANRNQGVNVVPLMEVMVDPNRRDIVARSGLILMGAVMLILLVACGNLSTLLMARATARQKEVAIRLSVGASRWQLVRQLLTESLLLGLVGGSCGLVAGLWTAFQLWKLRPPFVPHDSLDLGSDVRILVFSICVSLATILLFGLIPAIRASNTDLAVALKNTIVSGGRSPLSTRNLFIVLQVVLAIVSLSAAGLFFRSLRNSQEIRPGFETKNIAITSFDLSSEGYDQAAARGFYRRLLDGVESIAGVEAASMGAHFPLNPTGILRRFVIEGKTGQEGDLIRSDVVTPGYFETLRIPSLQGRIFRDSDDENSRKISIINQAMADLYWSGENPVGKTFKIARGDEYFEIAGVVKNANYVNLGESVEPYIYFPQSQDLPLATNLFVRTTSDSRSTIPAIRQVFKEIDASVPLVNIMTGYKDPTTMSSVIQDSLWGRRFLANLLFPFGLLTLTLVLLGTYGVITYSLTQRRNEMGIRAALGAQRSTLIQLILRESLRVSAVGILFGVVVTLIASQFVRGFLYNVNVADPWSYIVVIVTILTMICVAAVIPAWRSANSNLVDSIEQG